MPKPDPRSSAARAPAPDSLAAALLAAAALVEAVAAGQSLANIEPPQLPPAVRDLSYGALRDFGRGDFFLRQLLNTPLADAATHALLLVALHRLEARPAHAHTIVDQAVAAAGTLAGGRYRSLANGVLRSFLRQRDALSAAAAADATACWRHPDWWLARLRQEYPQSWQGVADAGNQRPPMGLRVNRRRSDPAVQVAELAAAGIAAQASGQTGLLLARGCAVQNLPGFAEGRVSVQDLGAQRAAQLLDLRTGQRVLDACAAPGGKSAHIVECADVALTALDVSPARAALVSSNLSRLGLDAKVVVADCRRPGRWWDGIAFDRILADVPCSASGVVRRHPDAKWLRREADIGRFAAEQAAILAALWPLLAAGGKLLYATCSVFDEENQRQVERFAGNRADCVRLPIDGRPALQMLPRPDHDGFFYALLEKRR